MSLNIYSVQFIKKKKKGFKPDALIIPVECKCFGTPGQNKEAKEINFILTGHLV